MAERTSNDKLRMAAEGGISVENQIKVLYFSKTMEGNDVRNN
jgi:hypothetical protein